MQGADGPSLFPATVVAVIDEYRVAINRGARDGVKQGQRFLVYEVGEEEIKDPETGESLGHLEIVRGTAKVVHVQELLATLESDQTAPREKTIRRGVGGAWLLGMHQEEVIHSPTTIPFDHAKASDKARPI
jgi:hypothetical protein